MRNFSNNTKRGCYMPGGGGGEPDDDKQPPQQQQDTNIPIEEK